MGAHRIRIGARAGRSEEGRGWLGGRYEELEEEHLSECEEHERTGRWVGRLVRAVVVLALLLAVSLAVVWRLLA